MESSLRKIDRFTVFLLLTYFSFAVKAELIESKVNQHYVYEIFYKKISIGEMVLNYQQKGKELSVNSRADLSFLYYSFGGSQQSKIYWDEQHDQFLNRSFFQKSRGFGDSNIITTFDNDVYKTEVIANGVKTEYSNKIAPIVDFNAINLQISKGLKDGKRDFEFYMQTDDDISHYFFQMKGKEVINTKFGNIEAYRIEQIKKPDRSFIAWFAPDWQHHVIKFHYKRKVLDIRGELIEHGY
jgi:hypothetical protein